MSSQEGASAASEERAVAVQTESLNVENPIVLARLCAQSGMWADAQDAAKAFVKIQAGRELGLPAIASMTSIHVFAGKVTLGSNAAAALIKKSAKYDFRVVESTADRCEIEFLERRNGGEVVVGTWNYSIQDAKQAGLLGKDNWKKAPRDMCFARALMGGARKFCGDVILGAYDRDELEPAPAAPNPGAEAIRRSLARKETVVEVEAVKTHDLDAPNESDDEAIV